MSESETTAETTTETTTSLPAGLDLTAAQRNKARYQKQIDEANDLIYAALPELTKVALEKAKNSQDTRLLMDLMNRALGKPVEVKEVNNVVEMRQRINDAKEELKEKSLDELQREYREAAEVGPQSEG